MRYTLLIALSLVFVLSSCGKGTPTGTSSVEPTPYPSVPLTETQSGTQAQTTLTPPPPATTTDSFSAKGTEPFWAVEIDKNTATLSRPGASGTETSTFTVEQDDKGAILSIKGVKGDFFLTLVKSECSDGMSDMRYAYSATLNVGSDILRGCANRK